MLLENKTVVIMGGSSGIGLAIAKAAVGAGAIVTICSRSEQKLKKAKIEIDQAVEAYTIDVTKEDSVKHFFSQIEPFDHLVTTAAVHSSSIGARGPFLEIDSAAGSAFFESKFWGQYHVAKYGAPKIKEGGSITLMSGLLAKRPMPGLANVSAVNAAIEGLARALALEFAPRIRVNVVAPGLVLTSIRDGMPDEYRNNWMKGIISKLPLERAGKPDEVAQTYLYLMQNEFTTGVVIDVDGGHLLS